jgi:hypothetical protein
MNIAHAIRNASVVGLALVLSACALFAPPYDAAIDQKTTAGYEGAAKLAAQAEMGAFQDKATYDATVGAYSDVQAALAVAAVRARTSPTAGKAAITARDQTVGFIEGCSAQVSGLAALHKAYGVVPKTGATQQLFVACDQAVRAARAMKN